MLTPDALIERIEEFSSALFSLRSTLAGGTSFGSSATGGTSTDEQKPVSAAEEIEIDGETITLWRDKDGTTLISVDIGELPSAENGGRAIVRELLEANHLFGGTAGATLSLDPDTNRVYLQRKICHRDDVEDLPSMLVNILVDKAVEWRRRLDGSGEPQEILSPLSSGFMMV